MCGLPQPPETGATPRPGPKTYEALELVGSIASARYFEGTRYYSIHVRYGRYTWTLERRYRQFRELHLALSRQAPWGFRAGGQCHMQGLPAFPPRALHLQYAQPGPACEVAAEARLQALQVAADVCWRMLVAADVCSRMLTYAHVCSRLLTYADVWRAYRPSRSTLTRTQSSSIC